MTSSSRTMQLGATLVATLVAHALAQSTSLPVAFTSVCPASQFYDTSSMACSSCSLGAPTPDQRACQTCDTTSGSYYSFDSSGFTITQAWGAASSNNASTNCACSAPNAVFNSVQSAGQYLGRCVVCPAGTTADHGTQQCLPATGGLDSTTPAQDLAYVAGMLGLNINWDTATRASFPVSSVSPSVPLAVLLGPAAKACLVGHDRMGCNALANLCVLQLYNQDAAACVLYARLVSTLGSSTATSTPNQKQSMKPNTGPLPWLYYATTAYASATDMGLRVQFSGGDLTSSSVSSLTFMLSVYTLNGTWLGWTPWTSQMQLCGMTIKESTRWLRFGWQYDNSCAVSLQQVMTGLTPSREPLFFDLYLQTSSSTLYPLPVVVNNYANNAAVRRFFYVDGALGTVQDDPASTSSLLVVQYPTSMTISATVWDEDPSVLLPPVLTITYASWPVLTDSGSNQDVTFHVRYQNPPSLDDRFWYAWRTMLIVFEVVIGFPLGVWRLFLYMRKRKGEQADQEFLVYMFITICDVGSLALCPVLAITSLYFLIVIKLQEDVYFLMLPDSDIYNFKVTMILAIVGQTVGLLYHLYCQVNVDVFFLDWEKPRRVLSRDGNREEDAPVSAWRMLMVANEFAELQTQRITHPGFTWLMMVMILVGSGVGNSGNVTPDAKDYTTYTTAETSILLRFGIGVAFLLVLFLGQYMFKRLLWFPYASDPVMNFVDLMYLANISMVLLDERHTGYYVHGRNHSQHSDATLRDLNVELEKEGEGLVANRGLVTTYTHDKRLNDNQLFVVYINDDIRRQYESKMLRQAEQAANDARMRRGQVAVFIKGVGKPDESGLKASDQVADLFRTMIEDVERNHATQVVDPTYLQRIFQMPPEASINNTVFVHDHFRSFSNALYLGSECRLFLWESLFFLAVDSSLRNFALAALLTWVTTRILAWVRGHSGKNNISEKTMVDGHFLI